MFACERNMLFLLHEKLYDWRGLYFICYINMTDFDRPCVHNGSQYFNMTVICLWYKETSNGKRRTDYSPLETTDIKDEWYDPGLFLIQ
jgi:hypothetical protein